MCLNRVIQPQPSSTWNVFQSHFLAGLLQQLFKPHHLPLLQPRVQAGNVCTKFAAFWEPLNSSQLLFFSLRPLFGSSDASGNGSASDGRHTPTTAAIRALTIHPSWTAASRRCPPSAPARSMLPPDPTLQHGPTPPVESFTRDPREEVGPARCPGLLRTRGQA